MKLALESTLASKDKVLENKIIDHCSEKPTKSMKETPNLSPDKQMSALEDKDDYCVLPSGTSLVKEQQHAREESERRLLRSRRRNFLVFVRLLIKCLEASGEKTLTRDVKVVVMECLARHREGHSQSVCLIDEVEQQLKGVVGDGYWGVARDYLAYYHKWKSLSRNTVLVADA